MLFLSLLWWSLVSWFVVTSYKLQAIRCCCCRCRAPLFVYDSLGISPFFYPKVSNAPPCLSVNRMKNQHGRWVACWSCGVLGCWVPMGGRWTERCIVKTQTHRRRVHFRFPVHAAVPIPLPRMILCRLVEVTWYLYVATGDKLLYRYI